MATQTATAGIGDAVLTPDGVMHAVLVVHDKGRIELACGLLAKGLPLAESPDAEACPSCTGGTTNPLVASVAQALEVPTDAAAELVLEDPAAAQSLADGEAAEAERRLALEGKGPLAEAIADAAHAAMASKLAELPGVAAGLNPDTRATFEAALEAASATTSAIANQPSKAAIDAKQVGHYSLEQLKKDGPWRVRDTRSGKLEAEGFELLADAGWFAQRRTRLGQYQGFGGSKKLFMPKVPGGVGPYVIAGELGAVELQRDGVRVGPVWRHKTNGRVDAMRWAERLLRPTRAAS